MEKKNKVEEPSFFKELGEYMKPYNMKYALSIILSVLSVCSNIVSYIFVGFIASNLFEPTVVWNDVLLNLIFAILFKLMHALLLNLSTHISHKAAYFTLQDIRLSLTNKMLKLPMGYFETNGTGRLKTLLVDQVENMEKTLAHMLPELTANLLAPLSCLIYMFVIDYRIGFLVIAWIFLGMSVTGGMMKGYEKKLQGQIAASKAMNQGVVEYVNGIEVIKNFGREGDIYNKYQEAMKHHASYNVNWQKETQVYSALGMAIAPFSLFPVILLGLYFFATGSLEAPTLIMLIILTFAIFGPIMQASSYFDQLAGLGINAKEIKDVLDYKELKRGNLETIDNLNIEFKDVYFGYEEDKMVLNNLNFKIKEGSMFALVGPSGSGKSTIGKLLGGYFDVTKGDILIGDHSISEYSQDFLNKLIAVVDQDTFLFDMSIKDNIRLSNPTATDEEVIEASKKAGCHDFIMSLPNGYETMVGEAGDKLSGGEKQRIAIVRAMMKNSPIIILDEATASTDPENEAEIQKALLAASKGKTLIVIAHRLYTIREADQIAYVDEGRIKDIGTHEELLERLDDYQNLYELSEGTNHD